LALPVFGAGVMVGWMSLERSPPPREERAESVSDPGVQRELGACQEELAARSEARATPSATAAPPEEVKGDASEPVDEVEALKKEIKACRKSAILRSAEICIAASRHFAAMIALPDNDILCLNKALVASFLEEDFEQCDEFQDIPADLDSGNLTKEELSTGSRKNVPRSLARLVWIGPSWRHAEQDADPDCPERRGTRGAGAPFTRAGRAASTGCAGKGDPGACRWEDALVDRARGWSATEDRPKVGRAV
jgi:hypothetical protein